MLKDILLFLVFMLVFASVLREDFVFTIIYLMASTVILSRLWIKNAMGSVQIERAFESRVFIGEKIPVKITIRNRGKLPLIWLSAVETTPVDLRSTRDPQHILSLPGNAKAELSYELSARKRGFYSIGPLQLSSSDLLGINKVSSIEQLTQKIIIYPKIVSLPQFQLTSRLPMGTLKDFQPIFEDPTRTIGKRNYSPGDSLRRIDWKTSASLGRLQVKNYESSIELQTALFLNLSTEDYPIRSRYHDTELAITTAASIANWSEQRKQVYGLWVNGSDSLDVEQPAQSLQAKKGRSHLMSLFEFLARAETISGSDFVSFIHHQRVHLRWGTTLVIITPHASDALFDEIYQIHRAGHQCILLLCGLNSNYNDIKHLSTHARIPIRQIRDERGLERLL